MSATRPLGRLLASTASTFRSPAAARTFSSTPLAHFRRQRPVRNAQPNGGASSSTPAESSSSSAARRIKAAPQINNARTAPYSETEIEDLKQHFSPEQLSALLAGDWAIDRGDFERRVGRREGDPFGLKYVDDLSTIDPILDFAPEGAIKASARGGKTSILQNLPKVDDPTMKFSDEDSEGNLFRRLQQQTGMPLNDLKGLRTRLMVQHSVTNQTRMGKIRKVYALAVAGNGNGLLGIGEGKSVEAEDAIRQATYMAMRSMEPIPRYEGRTIYGDVEVKQGAVEMKLFTRPPGFGVRCSAHIFEMCRCLGIRDLSARVTRSRNPMNVIKTFMKALKSQKLPETIARGRGKKFVDVRKVYYGGVV